MRPELQYTEHIERIMLLGY